MTALQAIVYGVVQGITEFLPVSSTAHLRIVAALAGWDDPGAAFTAVLQLGTLAAVVVYFRTELTRIVRATLRSMRVRTMEDPDAKLGWGIGIGTIPIVIVGFALRDVIEGPARDLRVIAGGLGLFSLVMLAADRLAANRRDLSDARVPDSVAIGSAQVLALVPGVSRSGATLSMGLFRQFTRASAARFSFLLSVPAVALSGLFELRKVADPGGPSAAVTALATLAAFVLGYASIAWLLKLLTHHSLTPFVVYRIALAVLVLVLLSAGAIPAR
ncbi:MAG: undecaprenyl-diphosphate phosphatase [Acidimicrobiales bacterium]